MSYFNEPARLAVLALMPEVNRINKIEKSNMVDDNKQKGLLTRNNMSKQKNKKSKNEIEKIAEYMSNIRTEMNRYKNGI